MPCRWWMPLYRKSETGPCENCKPTYLAIFATWFSSKVKAVRFRLFKSHVHPTYLEMYRVYPALTPYHWSVWAWRQPKGTAHTRKSLAMILPSHGLKTNSCVAEQPLVLYTLAKKGTMTSLMNWTTDWEFNASWWRINEIATYHCHHLILITIKVRELWYTVSVAPLTHARKSKL